MDNTIDVIASRDLDAIVPVNKTGSLKLISGKNLSGTRVSSEFPNALMVIHDMDEDDDQGDEYNDRRDEDEGHFKQFCCSVMIDVKLLQQFLSSFVSQSSTLHINLRMDQYATFSLQQHEMDVTLTLPNQHSNM